MARHLSALVNSPPNRPGQVTTNINLSRNIVSGDAEGADAYLGWNPLSRNFEGITLMSVGSAESSGAMGSGTLTTATQVGQLLPTMNNSGTIAFGNDGLVFTTGATSTNYATLQGTRRYLTTTLNKIVTGKFAFQLGALTNAGNAVFGIFNTQVAPVGTDPTNGVWINVNNPAGGPAVATGYVNGANTGKAATAAFGNSLVTATYQECGFQFYNTGGVATSWGNFWWGSGPSTAKGGTALVLPFTAAQLALLVTMTGNIYAEANVTTGSANAFAMTLDAALVEVDR
jgi:hypothetical protein